MKNKIPSILLFLCFCTIALGCVLSTKDGNAGNGIFAETKHNESEDKENKISPQYNFDSDALTRVGTQAGTEEQIKDYHGYRVSFNRDNHTANWVAWELLSNETQGEVARYKKFWHDEEIAGCAFTDDYKHSGYDRGHLCPAADMKWSTESMVDCFSLANIAPQDGNLNRGAWNTLEDKCREWAKRDSALIIVAGPIYSDTDKKRIGTSGVRVPGAYYKVIAAPFQSEPRGIAFVYPNMSAPGNMENYVMTIRDVEKLTGLDFFYNLPEDIEEKVENVASFREWNRK